MPTAVLTAIAGAQQSAIAAALRKAGWSVRGTGRKSAPGTLAADLETGTGLAQAFEAADLVVLTLPQDHRPGAMGRITAAVTRAAAQAGVGRLIFNPATRVDETATGEIFTTFRALRDIVLSGATPATVVEPTVFMDNLVAPWSLSAIASGTLAYAMQPDTAVAWVSHRTLAQAVVAATATDAGQIFRIGGDPVTPQQIALLLSARCGHPVAYAPIPLDGFAASLNDAFGFPAGDRIAELYANLAVNPAAMTEGVADLARLGVVPEPMADFIARTDWRAPA